MSSHVRRGPGRYRDWSIDTNNCNADHSRFFVTIDADDLDSVRIEEAAVTSEHPSARPLRGGYFQGIAMTIEEAEWLLSVLPLAIVKLKQDVSDVADESKQKSA